MRLVKGYQLKAQDIFHLTQDECEHLITKMGVFAIAPRRVSDNPIVVQNDSITTYYTHEEYAHETLAHVQQYLHKIKREDKVRVTLVETMLALEWDDPWLTD